MGIGENINSVRRKVMHTLTKDIGNPDVEENITGIRIERILISRPNGRLGNQLLITPLVQEASILFPNSKIDLFVRGKLAYVIFENYSHVSKIMDLPSKPFNSLLRYVWVWIKLRNEKYDLVINVENNSSSGKLSVMFARSRRKLFNVTENDLFNIYKDYRHMAKEPVYNLRKCFYGDINLYRDIPVPPLNLKLDSEEKKNGAKILKRLVCSEKKTICIYTYATGAKCYSKEWWFLLYGNLLKMYGSKYNIIEILPKENISQIDFKAPCYYSLNIREIASVIANTAIFIGADCGMMHLACASGTTTIGLFSVTDMGCYAPYGNKNTAINTDDYTIRDIMSIITARL